MRKEYHPHTGAFHCIVAYPQNVTSKLSTINASSPFLWWFTGIWKLIKYVITIITPHRSTCDFYYDISWTYTSHLNKCFIFHIWISMAYLKLIQEPVKISLAIQSFIHFSCKQRPLAWNSKYDVWTECVLLINMFLRNISLFSMCFQRPFGFLDWLTTMKREMHLNIISEMQIIL